ncbi:hypothetical protein HPB50_015128 [Hyalomma asiaticum]|uniref:Uncharacterized protein n=1 Tax=Hyalomma asiaticum TaxID=266040 RepID=A0ACB7SYP4_HYAAI|nr:hypothetical protein HPB50_015128 [Hyalomma asiaticum]
MERAEKYTKAIQLSQDTAVVDPHLLHHWEACRGLTKSWNQSRCNPKLNIRIYKLFKEAQEHAEELEQKLVRYV